MNNLNKTILFILLLMVLSAAKAQNLVYVHFGAGNDINNTMGTINSPFKNLQPAIDFAQDGDIILITFGTTAFLGGSSSPYIYLPTDFPPGSDTNNLRNRAFHNDGKRLTLLGGHVRGSYFLSSPTVLSGDFNNDDDPLVPDSTSENAYHVFILDNVLDNVDHTIRFDRIEFQGGNANGTGSFSYTMSRPLILQNQGAGLYIVNETPLLNPPPLLIATLFSGNHADANGAALYNHNSSPQLFNSVFNDNTSGGNGAGIYNDATSSPEIINATFVRNDAIVDGGGLYNQSATPVLVSNTVFYDNTATNGTDIGGISIDVNSTHNASDSNGGGIASGVGFVDLSSSMASEIFEDILNPEIIYTTIILNGEIVDIETAGFVPVSSSPLFNKGLTSANTLFTTIDFPFTSLFLTNTQLLDPLLKPRLGSCAIDIGAFEVSKDIVIHVDATASDNNGGGGSWNDAIRDLQVGIDCAKKGDAIHLAQGIYKPTESPDEISVDPRDRAFHIDKTITVRGGYDPITGLQDFNTPSILSGDFLDNDVITGSGETLVFTGNDENAFHVVVSARDSVSPNNSSFENLIIQGGNADGVVNVDFIDYLGNQIQRSTGGGMFNFRTLSNFKNMIFTGNSARFGGGIANTQTINVYTDVQFIDNRSDGFGGGLFTATSSRDNLTNVVFSGNLAGDGGGILYNIASGVLTNVLFINNHALGNGGGLEIINQTGISLLTNVTFVGNSAAGVIAGGGGLYASIGTSDSPPVLRNTIFYGNSATNGADLFISSNNGSLDSNSTFNASDGTGAGIDTFANFTDLSISSGLVASDIFTDFNDPDGADNKFATADDGLVPLSTSSLVNTGDNTANPKALDLANVPRVFQTTIDKGAYEYFVEGVFLDGFEF